MLAKHPLPYSALFFDADSTLRKCTVDGQPCPNNSDEWTLMPNVKEILSFYDWDKIGLSAISNQGGIAFGFLTEDIAYQLLCDMIVEATGRWPRQGSIFLCPHNPNDGCICRKPKPYLLNKAETFWHSQGILYESGLCLYIGDMESDKEAAEASGIDFMYAKDFFGWDNATSSAI